MSQCAANSPCPASTPAKIFYLKSFLIPPSLYLNLLVPPPSNTVTSYIIFFSRKFQNGTYTVPLGYNSNHLNEFLVHAYISKLAIMGRQYNHREVSYPEMAQEN